MRRAKGKKVELSDLPLPPASDSMATCRPSVNSSGTPLSRAACGEVATMLYAGLAAPLARSLKRPVSCLTRFVYAISMTLMPVAMMMVIKCLYCSVFMTCAVS